jgi:hypothetical protein
MGDAHGVMRDALNQWLPGAVAISSDYRHSSSTRGGLHHCGCVLEIMFSRRWGLVIGHPSCAPAAKSNTTKRDERLASGELWDGMAFALLIYCAPAAMVIVEQPPSELEWAFRPPDQRLQFLDFQVDYTKQWLLWTRGVDFHFTPTGRASKRTAPAHRELCFDQDEREHRRSPTPPALAQAIAQQLRLGGRSRQPLFAIEVEEMATRVTEHGWVVPTDYATAALHSAPRQGDVTLLRAASATVPAGNGHPPGTPPPRRAPRAVPERPSPPTPRHPHASPRRASVRPRLPTSHVTHTPRLGGPLCGRDPYQSRHPHASPRWASVRPRLPPVASPTSLTSVGLCATARSTRNGDILDHPGAAAGPQPLHRPLRRGDVR